MTQGTTHKATPTPAAARNDVELGMRSIVGRSLRPTPIPAPALTGVVGVAGVVRYTIPVPVRGRPTGVVGVGAAPSTDPDLDPEADRDRDGTGTGTAPADALRPRVPARGWRSAKAEGGAGRRRLGVRGVGGAPAPVDREREESE